MVKISYCAKQSFLLERKVALLNPNFRTMLTSSALARTASTRGKTMGLSVDMPRAESCLGLQISHKSSYPGLWLSALSGTASVFPLPALLQVGKARWASSPHPAVQCTLREVEKEEERDGGRKGEKELTGGR